MSSGKEKSRAARRQQGFSKHNFDVSNVAQILICPSAMTWH
jgi:hypothetical protein